MIESFVFSIFAKQTEGSSKGKTSDFGSENRGSIPLPSTLNHTKKQMNYNMERHFKYYRDVEYERAKHSIIA